MTFSSLTPLSRSASSGQWRRHVHSEGQNVRVGPMYFIGPCAHVWCVLIPSRVVGR